MFVEHIKLSMEGMKLQESIKLMGQEPIFLLMVNEQLVCLQQCIVHFQLIFLMVHIQFCI